MKPSEIADKLERLAAEMSVIVEEADGDLSDEQAAEFDKLEAEMSALKARKERNDKIQAKLDAIEKEREVPASRIEPEASSTVEIKDLTSLDVKRVKSKYFDDPIDALTAGKYLMWLAGDTSASDFLAAQSVGTDNKGGFLVPDPLAAEIINLQEEWGVARRVCRRVIMSALTWTVPKLTASATISYPDEAAAISETDVTVGQVALTAGKMAALVKMSTEVTENSIISVMDLVVQDIAKELAKAEDENLFIGVTGGINADGIEGNSSTADTNVANIGAVALTTLTDCVTKVGNFQGLNNEWYMHPSVYHGQVADLVYAAGGNAVRDIENGQRPRLMGYPVNFVNAMPDYSATTSGDMLALFGDLGVGCYFGDRRSLTFKVLNELYAENDQVGVVATQRIDEVVANPEVLSKITIT